MDLSSPVLLDCIFQSHWYLKRPPPLPHVTFTASGCSVLLQHGAGDALLSGWETEAAARCCV